MLEDEILTQTSYLKKFSIFYIYSSYIQILIICCVFTGTNMHFTIKDLLFAKTTITKIGTLPKALCGQIKQRKKNKTHSKTAMNWYYYKKKQLYNKNNSKQNDVH